MDDIDGKAGTAKAADTAETVLSIIKLRELHGDLTREYGTFADKPSQAFLDKATAFQTAASAAGVEISSIDERLEIQSRINFWQSARINAGQRPDTVLLAPFDRAAAKLAAGDKAPYKGLAAFQKEDAKNFSGRYEIVGILVKAILTQRIVALAGASGTGKSSVIRAGLIPQLEGGAYDGVNDGDLTDSKGWKYPPPILPGSDPLGALGKVYGTIKVPADLPAALDLLDAPVLLSIDQFEEVFTLSAAGDRRNLFIDALYAAATTGKHRHIVLITMRSDFTKRLADHPTFYKEFEAGKSIIQTMPAIELRKVIVEPAGRLGVGFEPGLVDKLASSVEDQPAGLPLLSFTLLKLWEMRGGGPMKVADYEELGGDPRVILTRSADKVYESLPIEDRPVVKTLFTRMVQINKTLDATSKRIKREDLDILGRNDSVDRVLPILAANNLIKFSPAGTITNATDIEVGHEALIRNWEMLIGWVRDDLANETSRRAFAVNAETWARRTTIKDKQGDLLAGLALREAAKFQEKFGDLTETEKQFIAASKAYETWRERRRWAVTGLILALAIGLAFLSWTQFSAGNKERTIQVREDAYASAQVLVDRGELKLAKKVLFNSLRSTAGLPPSIAAELDWLSDKAPWLAGPVAAGYRALNGEPELPAKFATLLQAAAINEPREYVFRVVNEADWQAAMAKSVANASASPAQALGASIAADGKHLISLWSDGSARVWKRHADGSKWEKEPIVLTIPGREITAAALHPDGYPVTASIARDDREAAKTQLVSVHLDAWNPYDRSPGSPELLTGFEAGSVTSIKFAPDGQQMVVATMIGEVLALDDEFNTMFAVEAAGAPINSAVFSDQGDRILAADADGLILIIGLDDTDRIDELRLRKTVASSARFTPSGIRFAVGSTDGIIRIYQTSDRTKLFELSGHRKAVTGIAISSDGARLVSSSDDGTIRYWELGIDGGRLARTIFVNDAADAPIAVKSVSLSKNGTDTVVALADGSVRAFDSNGKRTGNEEVMPKTPAYYPTVLALSADRAAVLSYSAMATDDGLGGRFQLLDTRQPKARPTWDMPDIMQLYDWQASDSGGQIVYTRETITSGKRKDAVIMYEVAIRAAAAGADEIILSKTDWPPALTAISPDGKFVITADRKEGLQKFSTVGKSPPQKLLTSGESYAFGDVVSAFSRSGPARFAIGVSGDPNILVYDLSTAKIVQTIKSPDDVAALQFSPDGKKLFVGTDLGAGAIHDIATGKTVRLAGRHDSGITFAGFSRDNDTLITGSLDSSARLWSAANGKLLHVLRGHRAAVTHAGFAPDGKRVLTESEDRTIGLWDTTTGQQLMQVRGPDKAASAWGWFAPDGKSVQTLSRFGEAFSAETSGLDTTPRIETWQVGVGAKPYDYSDLQAEACEGSGALTGAEIDRIGLPMKPRQLDCPAKTAAR